MTLAASPRTPLAALSPPIASPSWSGTPPTTPASLAEYALELISEFLTREKREAMLKNKWAKTGREQLGKDLGDIEAALCVTSRSIASVHAPSLLPVFLSLRRSYGLPASKLPTSITDPYLDILPSPPDPDHVPFREPTVQSTTAALYVNPRFEDAAALEVIEELVEGEREHVEGAGGTKKEMVEWITGLVESVEKRVGGSVSHTMDLLTRRTSSRTSHTLASLPSQRNESPTRLNARKLRLQPRTRSSRWRTRRRSIGELNHRRSSPLRHSHMHGLSPHPSPSPRVPRGNISGPSACP